MPAFFDTNVLIYAFDLGEPKKREVSLDLIDEHLVNGNGLLSVQVLREFYSATRKVSHPLSVGAAADAVRCLATFSPISEETELVLGAVYRSQQMSFSFWDSLIIEAALKGRAGTLLTEDLQHGQVIDGMRVENPFI